jgi:hypothetical protein
MHRSMTVAVKGLAGLAMAAGLAAGAGNAMAQGQGKLAAAPPVTYDNRYEIFGGIMLQNFQAGQTLPKRMNLGGVEAQGTYWLTSKVGVSGDFRGMAGTTPVFPNPYTTRPLVVLYEGMAGVSYRGPKNQRAAIDFHALAGVGHGNFTETPLPVGENVGLYSNRTKPMGVVGASLDFNRSKRLALRLSPDLVLEHFGSETREFFAISGGVMYRFGRR